MMAAARFIVVAGCMARSDSPRGPRAPDLLVTPKSLPDSRVEERASGDDAIWL